MVQIKNLSVVYPNGFQAIKSISTRLEAGKIYGIIGPNGAGKSTLLKAILNLIPHSGTVLYYNEPLKKQVKNIAYVEQQGSLDMDFPLDVEQCVLLGAIPKLGLFKRPGKKEKDIAAEAIKRVGLSPYSKRQIGELSGGQFRRMLIARALTQQADLFLLDEPFAGIDIQSEEIIIKLLQDLVQSQKTVLVVHHDLSKVHSYFDKLLLINRTLIAAGDTKEVFTESNFAKTFEIPESNLFAQ